MRVLWFTNDPMPAVQRRLGRDAGGSGHWMTCLLEKLKSTPDVDLDVVTAYPGLKDDSFTDAGVRYFVVGQPRFQPFFGGTLRDLDGCAAIVREREPDVVHFHGTERFYGLLQSRRMIDAPGVISLQGLLGPYLSAHFGELGPIGLLRAERAVELATRRGLLWRYVDYRSAARREREILLGARTVMGRTEWDRAYLNSVNPDAEYRHAGEILRPDFRAAQWRLNRCERRTIIFTNAGEPRRGAETLLRALVVVRREFPDAKLLLGGGIGTRHGYERRLRRTIAESGLADSVELLGYLDSAAMARALTRAHVFSIASFLENSPNSLCEAMQIGMPCVASYAGGIPSLVEHNRTGLLFPPGDAPLLASAILRIFRDDALAERLGRAARVEATERHDPGAVLSQLLDAYAEAGAGRRLAAVPVV
jgi:glycosyltransferase involved in cell wall biosynthesis